MDWLAKYNDKPIRLYVKLNNGTKEVAAISDNGDWLFTIPLDALSRESEAYDNQLWGCDQ